MKKLLTVIAMGFICGCSVQKPIDNLNRDNATNTRFEVLVSERHSLDALNHLITSVVLLDKTTQTKYLVLTTGDGVAMMRLDEPKKE